MKSIRIFLITLLIVSVAPLFSKGSPADLNGNALVFRMGDCKASSFSEGSGVDTDANGRLNNVSVFGRNDVTRLAQIATIKTANGVMVGRNGCSTTVSKIINAGGSFQKDANAAQPNHYLLNGLKPAQLASLFSGGRWN